MFYIAIRVIFAVCVLGIVQPTAAKAQVAPMRVSDIVVRGVNIQQTRPACTPDHELGFIGLTVPAGQVLMLTGFFWGASSQPGFLIESDIYLTDGDPVNRRSIARISGTAAANGKFAGLQTFPVPVPSFRANFTHLCINNATGAGSVIGTSTFQLYGFFAPDS
jgi:hypothetical protein